MLKVSVTYFRNEGSASMSSSRRHPLSAVVRAYVVLPHLTPIVAVMTGSALFAFVASGGWLGGVDFTMLMLAMFGGQIAIGAVNELVDVELDRVSKPSKPLVAGLATERGARVMVGTGMVLMILGSLRFSLVAFVLCALGTGLGVAYSFWFKRTPWSWVPYVLAIPLLPIWVWTALGEVPEALVVLYPIAVPAIVALQIAQSIPDIGADRSVGVRTLAATLGEQRAAWAARLLVILSVLLGVWFAPGVLSDPRYVTASGLIAVTLMGVDVMVWRTNRDAGRMRMFPLVVVAVGVLGVGWALGVAG